MTPLINYTEGLFTDYMYSDAHSITPRFEFGFGLSYEFSTSYSSLQITPGADSDSHAYDVSVTVQNTGSRAGTEIAQLYLGYPSGAGEPPKVLRGFEAIALGAGMSASVTFPLMPRDIRCGLVVSVCEDLSLILGV